MFVTGVLIPLGASLVVLSFQFMLNPFLVSEFVFLRLWNIKVPKKVQFFV